MEEDEVCTCGHPAEEHEQDAGPCHHPGCACQAYTVDVDDPLHDVPPAATP